MKWFLIPLLAQNEGKTKVKRENNGTRIRNRVQKALFEVNNGTRIHQDSTDSGPSNCNAFYLQ
ncbi:hypothetical protein [Aquibacillus albus]|uniref:hypothetical protein n=1 Tax=Aquibacillus albus TaxID=1168171 RepID=UPI0019575BBB|nr:hypothetical protein [Aquibacillus albus]